VPHATPGARCRERCSRGTSPNVATAFFAA
jgi:hypothetical protein